LLVSDDRMSKQAYEQTQAKPEWYKEFYTEPWISVQRALWSPERTVAEVDFIQHVLRLPRLSSILDIPCGDGRIAVELAGGSLIGHGIAHLTSNSSAVSCHCG